MDSLTQKLQEIRRDCDYFFNEKSRLAFLLPKFLPIFKNTGSKKKINERRFFLTLQDKVNETELLLNKKEFKDIEVKTIKLKSADANSLRFKLISKIYNNYPHFDYIIHGSYADNTLTPASDIDDLIILKKEVFYDRQIWEKTYKLLSKLNSFYRSFDPLEHHGHWIITEFDLKHYISGTMPLVIFDGACSIGRNLDLKISVENTPSQETTEKIWKKNIMDSKIKTEKLFSDQLNIYYLKDLISTLSLLVPLTFQLKGQQISKKTGISKSGEILDPRAISVLNFTTETRKRWEEIPTTHLIPLFRFIAKIIKNRGLFNMIAANLLPNIKHNDIATLKHLNIQDFDHFFDNLKRHEI